MILFKPEHAPLILSGRKTQTRRLGKKRWRIGALHKCYTRPPFCTPPGQPFATVRIEDVRWERLANISDKDVRAEGYATRGEYFEVFRRINGIGEVWHMRDYGVWRVSFAQVEALEEAG